MQDADIYPPAEPAQPPRMWSLRDMAVVSAAVVLLFLTVQLIVVLPATAAWGEDAEGTNVAAAVSNLIAYVGVVLLLLTFVRKRGGSIADLGLRRPGGAGQASVKRIAGISIVTFIVMELTVILYSLIALELLGLDFLEPSDQLPEHIFDQKIALAMLGLPIVIGAPFAEELFFRGFLFGGLRSYLGIPLAALLTGAVFALVHANGGLIIPFTLIGAILALSYQRSGNLASSIGAHFLFNLLSFTLLAFVPEAR